MNNNPEEVGTLGHLLVTVSWCPSGCFFFYPSAVSNLLNRLLEVKRFMAVSSSSLYRLTVQPCNRHSFSSLYFLEGVTRLLLENLQLDFSFTAALSFSFFFLPLAVERED